MAISYVLTEDSLTTGLRSGQADIDTLIYSSQGMANWNWLRSPENTVFYTFSLPSYDAALSGGDARTTAISFSAEQQVHARNALQYVDSVTGLFHLETTDLEKANLFFANADLVDSSTTGITIGEYEYVVNGRTGEIGDLDLKQYLYLDTDDGLMNLNPGSYGYETLLHELGHALGLGHPHEELRLGAAKDNTSQTLMSYEASGGPYASFRAIDLAALDFIYGGDGMGGIIYGSISTASESNDSVSEEGGNDHFEDGDDDFDYDDYDDTHDGYGTSGESTYFSEPDPGTYQLTVIADVFGTVLLLKDLTESVTADSHMISYNGIEFNYSEIDGLITTVVRDGEFTEEFAAEIAESYPSVAGISYSTAVGLVGSAAIDDVLLMVANADGSTVT